MPEMDFAMTVNALSQVFDQARPGPNQAKAQQVKNRRWAGLLNCHVNAVPALLSQLIATGWIVRNAMFTHRGEPPQPRELAARFSPGWRLETAWAATAPIGQAERE